jgi:hypothetical protein
MRMTQTLLFSAAVLVAVAGLALSQDKALPRSPAKLNSSRQVQAPTLVASTNIAADFPVVGYIEKRGRTITIKAGQKGPVYSVKTADGKLLFDNLSQEQLSAKAPELGEFLKTAVAGTPGAKTDARVRIKVDASVR